MVGRRLPSDCREANKARRRCRGKAMVPSSWTHQISIRATSIPTVTPHIRR